MNKRETDKATNNVFTYLDTVDLIPYMIEFEDKNIYLLMRRLEEVFSYKDEYSETLLDVIDSYEFGDYLNNRYGLCAREETSVKIIYRG